MGKAPIGVAKTAKKYGKPVIGFSGCVTKDAVACNREGIDAFFPILRGVVTLDAVSYTHLSQEPRLRESDILRSSATRCAAISVKSEKRLRASERGTGFPSQM